MKSQIRKNDARLLAVCAALLGANLTPAQTTAPGIQWQNSFGGNGGDHLNVVKQTSDGGYILGGDSFFGASGNKTNAGFGDYDYWVVKVDTNGNKQWEQSFGGSGSDSLFSLQQTGDGGYILGGYSDSGVSGNKTNAGFGGKDYWAVKLDANGNKQWDKSFGGTNDENLYSLQQTSDGGYILGGDSTFGASGNKTNAGFGNRDYWVVKVDTNGNKQWDKSFGGSGFDYLYSLQQTSDGGYILGGYSDSGISGNKTNASFGGSDDYWVVKLDANGNKQWDKSFGGVDSDVLTSLQQTSDGGYILGGHSNSDASGNKTNDSFGGDDYWVVKVDADGNKQWEQSFGGGDGDDLISLQQTGDGGYILGGYSNSDVGGNKTNASFGNYDYWVVKLDANGNMQWEQSFGGIDDDFLTSLQQTSDGGYILGGFSNSGVSGGKTSAGFGDFDYWVVKLAGPPLRFDSFSRGSNNVFQAQLAGLPGTNYIFQASTNLINWTSLRTNNAADGYVNFSDTNAASFSRRFYRAQQKP